MDLTGSWQGFYEQDGTRHGIEMRVEQHGVAFAGRMRDQDTLMMGGIDAEEAEQLRGLFDSDGDSEPELITSLPADSTIQGRIDDRRVRFVKHYLGAQQSALWIDDMHVQIEIKGHAVHYGGELDAAGNVLRGEWWIEPLLEEDEGEDADDDLADRGVADQAGQPDQPGAPGRAGSRYGDAEADGDDGEVEERGTFELRRVGG